MAERPPPRSIEARALDLVERAMDQPSDARAAWVRTRRDPQAVRARALSILSGGASALSMLPTGGAPGQAGEARLPDRIGAYGVTGLIGQGGMGAVYRGERAAGDFDHTVAIKVIRPGALSGALIERFRRERQTLARLAHPNIARLFDGGETVAGEPYIVMEFVDGQPLTSWLTSETPSRALRLDLFLATAAAVAFAHQNLIVHGDLTPANILVDRVGHPKLIDFGISSPAIDSATAATTATPGGKGIHTPGFAAPERIAGAPSTTLSDIYSLGRVLALLTDGDPADPELDAIVARAMADDPAARYPTVEALRDDVAAYRGGHPVSAAGGGRGYVFRKFVGRHRLAVGAAASAGALLVAAFALTLVANARAEVARAEAEARFQQTRHIAKTLLFEAYNEVSKVPGATPARALLAKTGLSYLDALAADGKAPLDVRLEVGRGYTRLAQVTGSGQETQLGKMADSNALLAKAQAVLKPAYAAHPQDPQVRLAYANLLVEQSGVNLYNNNKIALAREQAALAQTVLGSLGRSDPEAAKLYAIAMQAEGDSRGWDGDYAASRAVYLKAEAFMESLSPALQSGLPIRKTRSAVLRLLSEAQHELDDDAGAIVSLDKAVAINTQLAAEFPDDPGVGRKLSTSLWYRAVVLRELHREAEALASISRSVALVRSWRALDPKDAGALHLFAISGEVQAQVLADLRRFPESFAVGREVIAAHRQIVAQADDAAGARRSMATSLITIGSAHYNGGEYPAACVHWREADGVFRDLERQQVLTGHDRTKTWPELRTLLTANCDGGPPRAGVKGPL